MGKQALSPDPSATSTTNQTTAEKAATKPEQLCSRRFGVWTVYEHVPESWIEGIPLGKMWKQYSEFAANLPYLWRLTDDCFSLCPSLFTTWILACIISSFIPAMQLWLSGRLLFTVSESPENPAAVAE